MNKRPEYNSILITLINNLMQQQIQAEPPEEVLPHLDQLLLTEQHSHPDQELISEHYQEDFDPIESQATIHHDGPIRQQLIQFQQNRLESKPPAEDCRSVDEEEQRLTKECQEMQFQIASIQAQLQKYQLKSLQEGQTESNSQDVFEQLQALKNIHQQQLEKQQMELNQTLTQTFGRDTISMDFIMHEGEMIGGKILEEKLLEEEVRLNALLHCSTNEIAKMKRDIKKNGQLLETAPEDKDQMHKKYRDLFREGEQKKLKIEKGHQKIKQLDAKLTDLQIKISSISLPESVQDSKQDKKLHQRWSNLTKQKDQQQKKVTLLLHSCQNSSNSLNRLILDLKKQKQEVQQTIDQYENKNIQVEEKSQAILLFHQKQTKLRKGKFNNKNHFSEPVDYSSQYIQPFRSPSLSQAHNISAMRKRNFSVQRKPVTLTNHSSNNNISMDTNPFSGLTGAALDAELSAHDSILTELQTKLKECSTDSALKKQFKLKLPKNTVKSSKKYLGITSTPGKQINPKIFTNKNPSPSSKLSISQRIERIELLERQDKIHSNKVSASKVAKNKPVPTLIEPPQLQSDLDMIPALQQQKEMQKTYQKIKRKSNDQQKFFSSKRKMEIPSSEQDIEKTPSPWVQKHPFSQIQLPKPQHLFSQIQQKLQMRQSAAKLSFQLQFPDTPSQTPLNQSTTECRQVANSTHMSRLSRQSLVLKKRASFREKKITDDYMKVLEQRGRKILELDNENQT